MWKARCQPLIPHSWGFTEIEVERDLLRIGKFGLRRVAGVFPDGTPFRMPEDDPLPSPIDVGTNVRDQILYLAVPLRRPGEPDVDVRQSRTTWPDMECASCRRAMSRRAMETLRCWKSRRCGRDSCLPSEPTHAYASVPLAHLVECRADKQVILDESFIPTVMHARTANSTCHADQRACSGCFISAAKRSGGRVAATGRGGAAEFADFLDAAGDQPLRTFAGPPCRFRRTSSRRSVPTLRHPRPASWPRSRTVQTAAAISRVSTRPPSGVLRAGDRCRSGTRSSYESMQTAIPIPLEPRSLGSEWPSCTDRDAVQYTAVFILAARADLPAEDCAGASRASSRLAHLKKLATW